MGAEVAARRRAKRAELRVLHKEVAALRGG